MAVGTTRMKAALDSLLKTLKRLKSEAVATKRWAKCSPHSPKLVVRADAARKRAQKAYRKQCFTTKAGGTICERAKDIINSSAWEIDDAEKVLWKHGCLRGTSLAGIGSKKRKARKKRKR